MWDGDEYSNNGYRWNLQGYKGEKPPGKFKGIGFTFFPVMKLMREEKCGNINLCKGEIGQMN